MTSTAQQIAKLLALTGAVVSGEPIQVANVYGGPEVTVTAIYRNEAGEVHVAMRTYNGQLTRPLDEIELVEDEAPAADRYATCAARSGERRCTAMAWRHDGDPAAKHYDHLGEWTAAE